MKRPLEDAFFHFMKRHAWDFSEALTLESNEDFFYLSDLETYELYLISAKDPGKLNPAWVDYQGKRCYQVLQGRETPCPFCTNHLLHKERYHIWKFYNAQVKKTFMLKDRLVEWEGKTVRMEEALDISEQAQGERALLEVMEQQNLLVYWLRLLAKSGVENALPKLLSSIQKHFGARLGFIQPFAGMEPAFNWPLGGNAAPPKRRLPSKASQEGWARILEGGKQVIVRDAAVLRETDAESYGLLSALGVSSACFTPILSGGQLVGMIGLGDVTARWESISLLKMLAVGLASTIREAMLNEEKLRIQFVDPLTGHQNYGSFKLKFAKLRAENPGLKYSLWYCDIKRFKYINDIFGYDVGDRILKYWCDFVAAAARPEEMFCRISSDNLTALLHYERVEDLHRRFAMAAEKLAAFPELAERRFSVELAAGVYLLQPGDPLSLEEMTNRANIAQKSVKALPGSQLAFYTEEMRRRALWEVTLETQMREGLGRGEFQLYLQPLMAMRGGERGVRAEVLVRWQKDPGLDLIMPGEFVGLFEKNGMIVDLDHYVFEEACKLLHTLRKQAKRQILFAVNVSRLTMLQPEFIADYCRIKERYGIPDGTLELEFTENGVVEDLEAFGRLVAQLKSHGFLCAMDDFGTGQSSLGVLQRLPLDTLKLDREFFERAPDGHRNETVVSCVLHMARLLAMNTVAEGIEREGQVAQLREMGCDYIQGYIYARPMPADAFKRRILEGSL